MWKHEILTNLNQLAYNLPPGDKYKIDTEYCSKIIEHESLSIYAGDITGYIENTLQKDIDIEKMRPPYESILVMYYHDSHKGAVLIKKTENFLTCYSFRNEENSWIPCPVFCKFDMAAGEGKYINNITSRSDEDNEAIEAFKNDAMAGTWCALMVCQLLNCKNITLEAKEPPEKLNRNRIKKGQYPHYRYHVLMIDPGKSRRSSDKNTSTSLGLMPVHLCRGHFKEYTAEKPLFGKHTGRFWWDDFARGNPERGIVNKDYAIKEGDWQRGGSE